MKADMCAGNVISTLGVAGAIPTNTEMCWKGHTVSTTMPATTDVKASEAHTQVRKLNAGIRKRALFDGGRRYVFH